jgi:hypothetical protein
VLAPAFAIVALMVVPAMAQATAQVQCGSVECANGAEFKGQSTNQVATVQNPNGTTFGCSSTIFAGRLGAAQVAESGEEATVEGEVTSDTLSGCAAGGVTADIKSNATAAHPWPVKVQKNGGQITFHMFPNAQQTRIRFTVQWQAFGFSVATCTFGARSIQIMGSTQSNLGAVEGANQLELEESNSSECGTVGTTTGDVSGEVAFENAASEAVVVH